MMVERLHEALQARSEVVAMRGELLVELGGRGDLRGATSRLAAISSEVMFIPTSRQLRRP